MKRLFVLLLAACTKSKAPLPVPAPPADAGSETDHAASPRASHREALLAEAAATGLDVVFQGWLEPRSELGAATADTCLRIRAWAPATDAATPEIGLAQHENGRESTSSMSIHESWMPAHCVRRGARVTLSAGAPTEVVVVASAAFR